MDEVNSEENVSDLIDVEEDNRERSKRIKTSEIEKRPVPNLNSLRSKAYKFFTFDFDIRQWKCNLCGKCYTHCPKGGAPSLLNHLNTSHVNSVLESGGLKTLLETPKDGIKKFVVSTAKPKNPSRTPISATGFKQHLVRFIVTTDQPFYLVEDDSFRTLLIYLMGNEQEQSIPSATTLKKWIEDEYEIERQKLKQELQNNEGKISFVIDCWTSSNQHPFQGVIASWISNDWKICNSVIDLTILEGSHTGKNIAGAFENVLNEYDLWNKLQSITTDNASNMDTFFERLDTIGIEKGLDFISADYRVRCLAHILNLACQDIISSVGSFLPESDDIYESDDEDIETETTSNKSFIDKIRHAIRSIRGSPQRREIFKKCSENENLGTKVLLLDVRTRWNSTFEMIRRVLEYKKPFLATVQKISKLRYLNLEEEDIWQKLEQLKILLAPFEEATRMISQNHSPSLADTSTVYHFLFSHLEPYIGKSEKKFVQNRSRQQEQHPAWIKQAAEAGWDKLAKYYGTCDSLVYVVATAMDPRYKLQWFKVSWKKEFYEASRRTLQNIWNNKYKPAVQESSDSVVEPASSTLNISKLLSEKMQQFHKTDDELKRYLSESLVNPNQGEGGISGVLDWWKINEKSYPNLSRMARDFLSAAASGVLVERLFSNGPDLLTPRRQRLHQETIKKVLCLKQWFKREKEGSYCLENFTEALSGKLGM